MATQNYNGNKALLTCSIKSKGSWSKDDNQGYILGVEQQQDLLEGWTLCGHRKDKRSFPNCVSEVKLKVVSFGLAFPWENCKLYGLTVQLWNAAAATTQASPAQHKLRIARKCVGFFYSICWLWRSSCCYLWFMRRDDTGRTGLAAVQLQPEPVPTPRCKLHANCTQHAKQQQNFAWWIWQAAVHPTCSYLSHLALSHASSLTGDTCV